LAEPKRGGFMGEVGVSFMQASNDKNSITVVVVVGGRTRLKEIYPGNRILKPGHYNPKK
jgi:hypothetical protein